MNTIERYTILHVAIVTAVYIETAQNLPHITNMRKRFAASGIYYQTETYVLESYMYTEITSCIQAYIGARS
jgi:hypothetical protein